MKRYTVYLAVLIAVVSIWTALKLSLIVKIRSRYLSWLIDIAPWYMLIVFGCYCLSRLGYDMLTFNDYPSEIKKLEKDIIAAKEDLKKRGFYS